jgi:hypothetical protein
MLWLAGFTIVVAGLIRLFSDPKIKPGTGERYHRLGLGVSRSRDGESRGQAAGSRVTL